MGHRRVPAPALAVAAQALLVAFPLWAAANPVRILTGPSAHRHVHVQATGIPHARMQLLAHQPPTGMQFAFLMTDGSVLAQSGQGNTWYKYVPDITGNYANGTWTQVATMPNGYAPSAFSSAVLADGRLAVSGGEYNEGGNYQLQLTNLGAIYDPVKNTWTKLGHPRGWQFIGDSPNSVLPNGDFLVGQKLTKQAAYLNPATLKWTKVPTRGKADFNSEEGWTLLANGTILTADVKDAPNSEIYNPATGRWVSAGSTIVDLHSPSPYHSCLQYGPKKKDCYLPPGEIGPAILRPDGTVFATGSGSGPSGGGPGHTSIYHTTGSLAGTWTDGPRLPQRRRRRRLVRVPAARAATCWSRGVSGALYEFNGTTLHADRRLRRLAAGAADRTGPDDRLRDVDLHAVRLAAGVMGADDQQRPDVVDARQHLPDQRDAVQRSLAGRIVRRRVPERDQLSVGADRQQQHPARVLRAHPRSQHDGGRNRFDARLDELRRPVRARRPARARWSSWRTGSLRRRRR